MNTALLAVMVFLAISAFGQADVMIKQRAKDLSNQNNARQGLPPAYPSQARPAAAPAPAPATPPSLPQLKADLAAIKAGAPVTADLKQKLTNDILTGAQGNKPSAASANKLADDLANAFSTKPLAGSKLDSFVQQIDALLNPSKFPQAKPQGIYDAVQTSFVQNGLEQKKVTAIVDDLKALK